MTSQSLFSLSDNFLPEETGSGNTGNKFTGFWGLGWFKICMLAAVDEGSYKLENIFHSFSRFFWKYSEINSPRDELNYALEYWREMVLWRFVVMKRTQFDSRICFHWLWNHQHFRFRSFGPHSWEREEDWKSNCLNSHFLLIPNICA